MTQSNDSTEKEPTRRRGRRWLAALRRAIVVGRVLEAAADSALVRWATELLRWLWQWIA